MSPQLWMSHTGDPVIVYSDKLVEVFSKPNATWVYMNTAFWPWRSYLKRKGYILVASL